MSAVRTAVLVIDLQVGVLQDCFDVASVVSRSIALVHRARSAGVPVLWVQHEDEELPYRSPAWQLVSGLSPAADEAIIRKTYYDAFAGTSLRAELDRMGVTRVLIAGAQSDYCIRTTAQRAACEGYAVVLVSDAHTTATVAFDGVEISAEQIVAHTNLYFRGLRYPGAMVAIATHDTVAL